jgi:hypothetical protein
MLYGALVDFGKHLEISQSSAQSSPLLSPVQIVPQPSSSNKISSEPNVVTSKLTAIDDRIEQPYCLQINGWLNNTGDGTAYNLFLHVVAFNKEGLALNNYLAYGGMTGHSWLGLGFSLDYSGAPIVNCSITPIYSDSPIQTSNSTLP